VGAAIVAFVNRAATSPASAGVADKRFDLVEVSRTVRNVDIALAIAYRWQQREWSLPANLAKVASASKLAFIEILNAAARRGGEAQSAER